MRIRRIDNVLRGKLQRADKSLLQLSQKVKRTAQEGNTATDRLSAGKAGDRLVDHCLKNGHCQISLGCPFINQRLNIAFCENAAAGSNRVDLLIILCSLIEAGGICLQERRHLINKGPRATGTDTIHALFKPAGEIDDFRIFPAELYGNVCLWGCSRQSGGYRHDFLHKADSEALTQIDRAGACNSAFQ